jgi:PEP-CTERM motif
MCVVGWRLFRTFVVSVFVLGLADVARATPIASIFGPPNPFGGFPGVGIGAGRATQWQSALAFEDVTITADLTSFLGVPSTATAFLTTRIGPGTTPADEIAHATVALPDFFAPSQTVTLFTGLNLAPADYYLIITTPPATSGLWWTSDLSQAQTVLFPCDPAQGPCPVTIGAGNPAFPNWQMFTVSPAQYAPASIWTPFHFGLGEMHFSVDGTLAGEAPPTEPPISGVPEPTTIMLMLTGLAAGGRRLRSNRREERHSRSSGRSAQQIAKPRIST